MSSKPTLLIFIPIADKFVAELAAHYALQYLPGDPEQALRSCTSPEQIQAVLTNGSTGLSRAQMARMPALRIICSSGAGYENIDLDAAKAQGVNVTHAPGVNNATVADHALALMLGIARGLVVLDRGIKAGRWQDLRGERPTINGKRLGLLGLGNIGEQIARRAAGFNMDIGYHTRHVRPDLPYRHHATLARLAEQSDYLIVACPGGAATHHLINKDILSRLGAEGFLINIARGSVVDTKALTDALQRGVIAGAALDVLEDEPTVPEQLKCLDNLILTPHISGRSPEAQIAQQRLLMTNLHACFSGLPLLHSLTTATARP